MNKKQEIQNKIDHTKRLLSSCNSNIEDYKADAASYECEIEQLEKQLKECDELKLVEGCCFGIDTIFNEHQERNVQNGRCYPTKELAEIAMNNSNTRNKLEAYSRVIDPAWREVWNEEQYNYFICKASKGKYVIGFHFLVKCFGTVYMSEKSAQRIAQALSNKEIMI